MSAARYFFEIGYASAYADAYVGCCSTPPFELTDAVFDRAWEIAPEGADSRDEFDANLNREQALSEALSDCVGALQFILAFYEPGQTALDTEAWKQACAGGVRAYHRGVAAVGWTGFPYRADNGSVYRDYAEQVQ